MAAGMLAVGVPVVADAQKPPKPPKGPTPELSLAGTPNPATYGQSVRLSGRLRGSGRAGQTIGLEQNPHPFRGFVALATTKTDTSGDYAFTVKPRRHTRYRTVTVTATPYETRRVSPELLVRSRLRVGIRLSDSTPRRGQRVRFSGSVLPRHNGHLVYIQRRRRDGRWITIARTRTRAATGNRSRYSRRVRIYRTSLYRVRVRGHSDHSTGFSRRRSLRVH